MSQPTDFPAPVPHRTSEGQAPPMWTATTSRDPALVPASAPSAVPRDGTGNVPFQGEVTLDPDGRIRPFALGTRMPTPPPNFQSAEAAGKTQVLLGADTRDPDIAQAQNGLPRTKHDDAQEGHVVRPGGLHKGDLTRANGAPVTDNTNSLTAGERGPTLLQDVWLQEKLAHMDRELTPERRMHPKGAAAYGTFTTTHDVTHFSRAALFSRVGKQTDVFVRFSLSASERGSADDERDVRGFAVKFYTEQGNWDLVGNNAPMFFVRDAIKFVDLNHALRRDPISGLRLPLSKWDFFTQNPETLHQVLFMMSDRGIPYSYRHMHGFGVHAFSMINAEHKRFWVKFHWITQQGIRNLTDAEARAALGEDRDRLTRDLYESIANGDYPKWKLFIQTMPEDDATTCGFNPFDSTKVWPQAQFPLQEVGELVLNRNVTNFFAENEQSAFSPANIVPGIGFSPDKLLQGRLFSYPDAQRYRLGVNHFLIPVNAPRCPFKAFHRDGAMRTDGNMGTASTYEPNRMGEWKDQPMYEEPPLAHVVGSVTHWNHRADADYFSQPGNMFRTFSQEQKLDLYGNTARELGGVPDDAIKWRHIRHCAMADVEWGAGVAQALGLPFPPSASVSGWDAELVESVTRLWDARKADVEEDVRRALERMRVSGAERGESSSSSASGNAKVRTGGILSMLGMGGADKSQHSTSAAAPRASAGEGNEPGSKDVESKESDVSPASAPTSASAAAGKEKRADAVHPTTGGLGGAESSASPEASSAAAASRHVV